MGNYLRGVSLYRRLIRLHRNLPLRSRQIGDEYISSEFRLHKDLPNDSPLISKFLDEWTKYAEQIDSMNKQTKDSFKSEESKVKLEFEKFNPEQIDTLYELFEETKKPKI